MNEWVFYAIMFFGVFISSVSQMLLKKAAMTDNNTGWKKFLNILVIIAYGMFVVSTLCTVIAMRCIPLSTQPFWNSLGIVLVAIMGAFFYHEIPSITKIKGLLIVMLGMVIFTI